MSIDALPPQNQPLGTVQPEEPQAPQQADYFGFKTYERFTFPDGVSFIEFQTMDEGAKAAFQRKTSRDMILNRGGEARLGMDLAMERHELIRSSVTGWNLKRGNKNIAFSRRELDDFLQLANPKLVEELELAIRKANPWLMQDLSSEDIRKSITELEEQLVKALEREAGEASSSSR